MNINTIIAEYLKAKQEKNEAEKREKALAKQIELYANGNNFFDTDDYIIVIDERKRETIDTKAVYNDFPDFKSVYGRVTTYNVITAKEKQETQKKTA